MSKFSEELRVIPKGAWRVAVLLYILLVVVLFLGPMRHDRDLLRAPLSLSLVLAFLAPLPIILYTLLVGYIYGDAKRRGMRHVMWTWLALVPYFIGVAAYFILRDPMPRPCHGCGAVTPGGFTFCPRCGAALRPRCSQCGKPVEHTWVNCAYCGVKLPPGEPKSTSDKAELTT